MILIKLKKRMLVLATVGAALILGVAMIVSLKGDDKPAITTNPPPADDEPVDDAPVTPADEDTYVPPTLDDDDDVADEPEVPGDDDTGPGDDDDDSSDNDKARGLARAAQVHQRNMDRMMDKGKTAPQGLVQSMEMLAEKYAALQADMLGNLDNNGKHKGWGQSGKA